MHRHLCYKRLLVEDSNSMTTTIRLRGVLGVGIIFSVRSYRLLPNVDQVSMKIMALVHIHIFRSEI